MSPRSLRKYRLHRKRLEGLPWPRKVGYVANVLVGESYRRRWFGPFGPRLVEITLTHRCQCRCAHCYDERSAPVREADELTRQEVDSILKEASRMGFVEVNFTGGEPLVRRDIVDLVRTARSRSFVPKINTNGILLNESMVRGLGGAGLAWAAVSIDSADREKHDSLRRHEGCFDLAVAGIRRLIEQGIPASITTYARREGIRDGDLGRIIQLGHELCVETVRILFPVPMGGFRNSVDEVLSLEERERVRDFLSDPIVTMESPREGTRCTAAVTKLNILPDGEVTPCVFVPRAYGNIRRQPLKEVWAKIAEFDKMWKPAGQCPFCDPEFRRKLLSGSDMPPQVADRRVV